MTDIQEAIRAEVRAQVRAELPKALERILKQRDAEAANEYVGYVEAAKIVGMSVSWLQKARGRKSPKRYKVGGAVRYKRSELVAFLSSRAEGER